MTSLSNVYKGLNNDYSSMAMGGEHGQAHENTRSYDVCMVFSHKTSKNVRFEDGVDDQVLGRDLKDPVEADSMKMQMWKQRRETILKSLQSCGLRVFCFYSRDRDDVYVKIGADAQKLRECAVRLKYRLQLKQEYLGAYAPYRHDFAGRQENGFKDRRVVSHFYKTHQVEYPGDDAVFTTMDKIFLINHIIRAKDKDCAGINVSNLVHEKTLKAFFPLHESHHIKDMKSSRLDWILMGADHTARVHDYFGDKIAFYFVWSSFYWKWLVPLAIIGLLMQVFDLLCRTPDNFTAVPFCVLLSVWAIMLPHFWKRQESKYAMGWGSLDLKEGLEPARPEHWGEPRINPVTAQVENFYPWQQRIWRYAFSGVIVIFSGIVLTFVMALMMFMRHTMKDTTNGGILTWQIYLAAVVELMNGMLGSIARWLTQFENHRTNSEYDNNRLAKVMGFKFINSYFVLYYVAFFKKHSVLFGDEMKCVRNDCFVDMQSQLAVFVFFRLTISNIIEVFKPRLKVLYRQWYMQGKNFFSFLQGHNILELADMSAAEKESKQEPYSSFEDFDENLITHGYTTLFAVASPWVCAATLVGVIVEVLVDSNKLTSNKQRPMPTKVMNNEPWDSAFLLYGFLTAITNMSLLIFASNQYAAWTMTEKLVLFVFLEHLIFLSYVFIKALFPELPRSVEMLQLKHNHIVHRCLENIKVEPAADVSMFRDETGKAQMEVFEQDYLEDEDLEEPQLSIRNSGMTMYQGVMDVDMGALGAFKPLIQSLHETMKKTAVKSDAAGAAAAPAAAAEPAAGAAVSLDP